MVFADITSEISHILVRVVFVKVSNNCRNLFLRDISALVFHELTEKIDHKNVLQYILKMQSFNHCNWLHMFLYRKHYLAGLDHIK